MSRFEEIHRRVVSESKYKPFDPPPMNLRSNPSVAVDTVRWAIAWHILNSNFIDFDAGAMRSYDYEAEYKKIVGGRR